MREEKKNLLLFFDTETTGLPIRYGAPLSDLENWPRLVQLAWLVMDEGGRELRSRNMIIKPEGFAIPEAAAAIHGITTKRALSEGLDLEQVLGDFAREIEASGLLIGHNIGFDEMIVGAEFLRQKIDSQLFSRPRFCTMRAGTELCRIRNSNGYKWPRLSELHYCLFNEDFEGAHDALADVKATARCFFAMMERKII